MESHALLMVSLLVPHDGGDGILISDTKMRQAKAKATAYQLTDEHGLYLLVKPTGRQAMALELPAQGNPEDNELRTIPRCAG